MTSADYIRRNVNAALAAIGDGAIDFSVSDLGKTFDPVTNTMVGSDTLFTVKGAYIDSDEEDSGHNRNIVLSATTTDGDEYDLDPGDKLTDPSGRVNTVVKINEVRFGITSVAVEVECT